jgi:RNA recognition motif-containing protein
LITIVVEGYQPLLFTKKVRKLTNCLYNGVHLGSLVPRSVFCSRYVSPLGGAKKIRLDLSMKLYIGNLSWGTTTEDLKSHFEAFGAVSDAIVITDRESGRSRGFGFVTMDDESEANKAMEGCSGVELDGRAIKCSEATPRKD